MKTLQLLKRDWTGLSTRHWTDYKRTEENH